jgi:YgiT-type zinc finger domain-containing protein
MCKNCFEDGSRKESTTSITIEKNNHRIIIRNIPCFLCLSCGEKIISDDDCGVLRRDRMQELCLTLQEGMYSGGK